MKTTSVFISFVLVLVTIAGFGEVKLPRIFSDGMVLQRDRNIPVWGWASAKEKVTVEFNHKQYRTTASAEGNWRIELRAMKAGGPYTMKVTGANTILLNDILVGDVWLCAGQSNMVHQLNIHDVTYANDIASANYPAIRHFKIPTQTDLRGPAKDFNEGSWQRAVSEGVRPFSAVAYFFARQIYEKYKVPIGLINASVGGSPVESWISEQGFKNFPEQLKVIGQNKDTAYVNGLNRRRSPTAQIASVDKGLTGPQMWFAPDYVPKGWRPINIPGYWEDQGVRDLNGVVWYRKEVNVPQSMIGKDARLFIGRIVDADKVYINGTEVGSTGYQYPQRRYKVSSGVLKAGKNLFVVRVTNTNGKGGFVPDKPYCIFAGSDTVPLHGTWHYRVGEVFVPRPPSFPGLAPQSQPAAFYNGMIAPFDQLPVRGVLWYQGETNTGRPVEYVDLFKALIIDWREKFDDANLPFIFAQLPNFMDVDYLPAESNWAHLRESQAAALSLPNTAMTVTIDLGEWNDLHPDNKKDIGERMALAARKLSYGENIAYSGPLYQSHEVVESRVVISFAHVGAGLHTDDGEPLSDFAIAGEDKKFVWANARIEGDKVTVWSDQVPNPKYVRYAWADNPMNANLYNKEGLPASPFRIGEH